MSRWSHILIELLIRLLFYIWLRDQLLGKRGLREDKERDKVPAVDREKRQ